MHKLIFEVSDGNRDALREPIFLENLLDLPMGVKVTVGDSQVHFGDLTGDSTSCYASPRPHRDARL